MPIEFACFVTQEIFEKDRIDEINNIINNDLGQPLTTQKKSGVTSKSGKTIWILETKYVWEVDNFAKFLDFHRNKTLDLPSNFDEMFRDRIRKIRIVGLSCNELPYYQMIMYVETKLNLVENFFTVSQLVIPFQIYLEKLGGFSQAAYENSNLKPRYYAHFVLSSPDNYSVINEHIENLKILQKSTENKIKPNEHSRFIRSLPILNQFGLPTVLSAVNYYGGILSFVTHLEVFGGGGELQGCGITFAQLPQVAMPNFQTHGIEKEIAMFSPNLAVFFSAMGGINLHLFLVGLTTWIAHVEKIVERLVLEMGNERQHIQILLNENRLNEIEKRRENFVKIQGNIASIGIIIAETRIHVFEWLDEMLQTDWLIGQSEISIQQKGDNPWLEDTLTNRVGNSAYFQLIITMLKNRFEVLMNKLESSNNPTNQLTDFIYNQTEYRLSKAVNRNSIIEIVVAIAVGVFTFVSILPFLGIKPPT